VRREHGWRLLVDGTVQSYVDTADPHYLDVPSMRWLALLVEAAAPGGAPLRALHLGAGAMTLPRHLIAGRSGSSQEVVEIDPVLLELVSSVLPPVPGNPRIRVGDALTALAGKRPGSVDLVVADVFSGGRVASHVASAQAVQAASRAGGPGGSFLANIGDGGGLGLARALVASVLANFPHAYLVSTDEILRGDRFGNLVVAGTRGPAPEARVRDVLAADPVPSRLLCGGELVAFVTAT